MTTEGVPAFDAESDRLGVRILITSSKWYETIGYDQIRGAYRIAMIGHPVVCPYSRCPLHIAHVKMGRLKSTDPSHDDEYPLILH